MDITNRGRKLAVRSALLTSLLMLAATPALAGECPTDKVGANPLTGAATVPVGVTEMELSSIDLSKEMVNLPQHRLRYRHMEIALRGRTRCAEQRTPLSAMRRPLTAHPRHCRAPRRKSPTAATAVARTEQRGPRLPPHTCRS